MPWHIIMIFFALGVYLGAKSGSKEFEQMNKELFKDQDSKTP